MTKADKKPKFGYFLNFFVEIVDKLKTSCYNNFKSLKEVFIMDNKILFGILTILFNCIGVPCFMVGNTKKGVLAIVWYLVGFITVVNVIAWIDFIMGIIAALKIFQMSDEEYAAADKAELVKVIAWGA